MDAAQFVRTQFAAVRRVSDAVTRDLTDDLIDWTPSGTANPIAATLIHTVNAEDSFIQKMIQGKPQLRWETGDWGKKVGLKTLPGKGSGWEEARAGRYSVAAILGYQEEVHAATDSYLETLTPGELSRQIVMFGSTRAVADALAMLVEHTAHHIGEISALKGVQGVQGMPF